ncbi:phage integrase N-terminal SAM-like domain-containing protein [Massilia sp. Leaf139]|uniref:phage integrase N-terminal SAM-like domain-containing protein n=1 Tax=Massilia sp. Leaf139 TaxID=1736272 RepID=UPI0006FE713E|nr:hypothetical protein ASF77_21805 [Massilia sp. Leaf139]
MREQFQQYMQTQNYQKKTAQEYARFIEDLSRHCGRNIYELSSASDLEPLVARYNSGGVDHAEGNKYNGEPRAAIKRYLEFLQAGASSFGLPPVR